MKRLLIITSYLLFCIACFAAGNAKSQPKDETNYTTVIFFLPDSCYYQTDSIKIYVSDIYKNTSRYIYGAKAENKTSNDGKTTTISHGGENSKDFDKNVVQIESNKNIINENCKIARDNEGPYVTLKAPLSPGTIEVIFPFEDKDKPEYASKKDFLKLNINIIQKQEKKETNAPEEENIWKKIKSSYSPYWIVILIDWLVILCIVVLVVYLFYIRNKNTVKEQSDDTQEKVKDEDKKEKEKQSRSQKEDNRDVQLEDFKNLIINEMKNVAASQKSEFVSLKTELLSELSNLKEQIQINQNNADKTNSSSTRTIGSSQFTSGNGSNSTNELDTREVDLQDGKMVIVKDSQYKYFRIFSEKGRFYYTQNPDYGIGTWASDYNILTDAMTIKNPFASSNSRSIRIVERGKLTKVSDNTFEIAEKLVLEFV